MKKHKPFLDMCMLLEELVSFYELDTTLNILAKNITEQMGVKACTIRLLDEKTRTLKIVAAHGVSKTYLEKGPVLIDEHPIDKEVLSGECLKGKAIGVIRVFTSKPHDFTEEEIQRLRVLASLGGIMVDRARIWNQMQPLIEVSRSISSTLSLNEVLSGIVENAAKAFGFKAASIRLFDEEKKSLDVKATYGLSESYLKKGPIEVQKSPIDRECMEGRAVIVSDVSKDSRLQYPEEIIKEGIRAILSVPLSIRGTVIGVLRVYTSNPYSFTPIEINFISALASSGAIAIENARLFEHIKDEYEELTRDVWKWYDWGKHFPKF